MDSYGLQLSIDRHTSVVRGTSILIDLLVLAGISYTLALPAVILLPIYLVLQIYWLSRRLLARKLSTFDKVERELEDWWRVHLKDLGLYDSSRIDDLVENLFHLQWAADSNDLKAAAKHLLAEYNRLSESPDPSQRHAARVGKRIWDVAAKK